MIAADKCVLVLLAAGKSSRFGANKLEADFLNKPVGMHVVTALEDMPFAERVVVTDGCALDFAGHGFQVVHNDDPDRGMSHSVCLGVACAKALDANAVVIALADMPRVTAAHIYRLLDTATGSDAVVVSSDGVQPSPPGVFGRDRFDFLMALQGDEGARTLVASGRHVVTSPAELLDIDTPDDLERLRALVRSPELVATRPVHGGGLTGVR